MYRFKSSKAIDQQYLGILKKIESSIYCAFDTSNISQSHNYGSFLLQTYISFLQYYELNNYSIDDKTNKLCGTHSQHFTVWCGRGADFIV